ELEATTAAIVAALADLGVHKGDRVAWFGKNCTLYFALFFAVARAGIVMVPIGWRLAPAEAAWIAGNAEVKAVFLGEGFEAAEPTFAPITTL
ncbi:AMP-binding protein, partial [Acinetobacter baumannii]